jgi:hypothetical protein
MFIGLLTPRYIEQTPKQNYRSYKTSELHVSMKHAYYVGLLDDRSSFKKYYASIPLTL